MKKSNKKTQKIIVGVLIAVGSYVSGVVSVKNPEVGKLIEKITTIISTELVQIPADTIPTTL